MGVGRQEGDRDAPEGSECCVFQKGESVSALLALAPRPRARQRWKSIPPPQMFTVPLGHPFWVGKGAVPERQASAAAAEAAARVQRGATG